MRHLPRSLLLADILCMSMCAGYLAVFLSNGSIGEIQRDYYPTAEAMARGHFPYVPFSGLRWEYPPLSYLFILLPRIFASDSLGYQMAFGSMVAAFLLAGNHILYEFAKERGHDPCRFLVLNIAMLATMLGFVFERYDAIPAMMSLAAVFALVHGSRHLSMVLLAIGALAKLYPAMMIPAFLAPSISRKDWKTFFSMCGTFVATSVLLVLPFMIVAGPDFMHFIEYHSDRGLQIESLFASFLMTAEQFVDMGIEVTNSYGSFNLSGESADLMASMSVVPMGASFILLFISQVVRGHRDEEGTAKDVAMYSSAYLLCFVLFNKVFSAQYMIWLIPVVLVAAMYVESESHRVAGVMMLLAALALTAEFSPIYGALCEMEPLAVLVLLIRNLLVLSLLLYVALSGGWIGAESGSGVLGKLKTLGKDREAT